MEIGKNPGAFREAGELMDDLLLTLWSIFANRFARRE